MLRNPKDGTSLSNLTLNTQVHAYYHRPRLYLSESDQNLLRRPLTVVLMRSLKKNAHGSELQIPGLLYIDESMMT